jgi:hypothetical protein
MCCATDIVSSFWFPVDAARNGQKPPAAQVRRIDFSGGFVNEEELADRGKVLKQVLMQVAIRLQQPYRPFSLSAYLAQVEKEIQQTIDLVQNEVRPSYGQEPFLLKDGARTNRGFDAEHSRLKVRVLDLFVAAWVEKIPELESLLSQPHFQATRNELSEALRALAEKSILPIVGNMPKTGEDVYLQLSSWVYYAPEEVKVQNLVDMGITSTESPLAAYGMFGLLLDAQKAYDEGDMERAYSYLIDLSHFVGMRDGAHSVTSVLPALAEKKFKVQSSHNSRNKKHADAARAAQLFCDLRPKNERGLRDPWRSAEAAADTIWEILEDEARNKESGTPDLRYSGLKTYCARWMNDEENGGTLDLDIRWVRVPPDDNGGFPP